MAGFVARAFAFLALAVVLGFAWFTGVPPRPAPALERSDGIVVLTGDRGRIQRGLELLSSGAGERLLISGVAPGVKRRELAAAAHAPLALFESSVDLGFEAVDTRSNAEETAAWVRRHRYRSVRLVTSDYHYRRAALELEAELGPGVKVLGEPVRSDPVPSPKRMLREYGKFLVRAAARLRERL